MQMKSVRLYIENLGGKKKEIVSLEYRDRYGHRDASLHDKHGNNGDYDKWK